MIVAIIQTYAASDPGILSIDRKIRIFASVFFVVTAFMPIAVVSLALALHAVPKQAVADPEEKEPVGSPTTALSRTTSADATVVDQEAEPNPKTAENKSGIFFSHVPTTGYGPTPSSGKEIVKNIAVIIIPAVLLTIEQGIRAAQIYYVPKPGVHLPWVRAFVLSSDVSLISQPVYVQGLLLDVYIWHRICCYYHFWCDSLA